ncbi:MAG: hypothetical protein DMF84_26570 [Acidobacteria bacterium]|nr:MAG: hypothetical protein DMF84_26570 [Acidobacteriota bacterium]
MADPRTSCVGYGAALIVASLVLSDLLQAAASRVVEPRRLAIYYGIPSLVNGAAGDLARAAAVFADYEFIVLGDGLEFDDVVASRRPAGVGAVEYRRTAALIAKLAATRRKPIVFGYIDLGRTEQLTLDEIRTRIDRWKAIGAGGILFDEAGTDFGVTRDRQNAAVDAVHRAGLRVLLNAFNPDDAFSVTAEGVAPRLKAGDAYLLESFMIRQGVAEDPHAWCDRVERAMRGAAATGASVFATATAGSFDFDRSLLNYAWWAAVMAGVDAFGWGEPSFSATDSQLPWRGRPSMPAAVSRSSFTGPIASSHNGFQRPTSAGVIHIDTVRRRGRFTR